MQLNQLVLTSNAVDIIGRGPVALPGGSGSSNLDLRMSIETLEPLRRLAGARTLMGEGNLNVAVTGQAEGTRFTLKPNVNFLIYDDLRLSSLRGEVSGTYGDAVTVDADLQTGFIYTPSLSVQGTNLEASYAADTLRFDAMIAADRDRDVQLGGYVDLLDERNRTISLEALNLRLVDEQWALLQETMIRFGEQIRFQNFLLTSGTQQIAIDGIIDFEGDQNLIATIERLEAGAVADLLGYPGLNGVLDAFLLMSGPADNPQIEGAVTLSDIRSGDTVVGALGVDINYNNYRLDLNAVLEQEAGNDLTAQGFLPVDLSLTGVGEAGAEAPIEFEIRADRFSIGWVQPFLDPETITTVDGLLTAEIDITGSQGDPELSGQARLVEGVINLPSTNVPYRNVELEANLEGNVLTIESARLRSDPNRSQEGVLTAEGRITFPTLTQQEYDLSIVAENFKAIDVESYRGVIDADLVYSGTSEAPILNGDVEVSPMDIFLTDELTAEEFEPVELTERDIQVLEDRFGYRIAAEDTSTFVFFDALTMNLNVELGQDVWIRSSSNPKMDIEFEGDLEVRKVPYEDQQLFGTVTVLQRRSYIEQFGKRFRFDVGDESASEIRFNGPIEEMTLDLQAGYQVPGNEGEKGPVILLLITGRMDDIEIAFQSSEVGGRQLDDDEIISYIVTGRPPGEGFFGGSSSGSSDEGSSITETAANIALGQFASVLSGLAGDEFGLDIIEIEPDISGNVMLTVGKYITIRIGSYVLPTLYATVRQPISVIGNQQGEEETGSEVAVEFEVLRNILLRIASQNRAPRFNLIYEFAY